MNTYYCANRDLLIRGYLAYLAKHWLENQSIDRCTVINLNRLYIGGKGQ